MPWGSLTAWNQNYSYDGVNRLASATDSGGWTRAFCYDAFGNMWVTGGSGIAIAGNTPQEIGGVCPSTGVTPYKAANNQLSGVGYDAAGNQTTINGNNVLYDGENRIIEIDNTPAFGGAIVFLCTTFWGSG